MRQLMQQIEQLDREELRLERWRERNRVYRRDASVLEGQATFAICNRCARQSCGPADYAIVSDVLAMRVGFLCAVEAWLLREAFETALGQIRIDVVQ